MGFLKFSNFVKRFFVFDMSETRAIMYYNSSTSTDNPKAVIPLHSLIAVRKENPAAQSSQGDKFRGKSGNRGREDDGKELRKRFVEISPSDKPRGDWTYVLEFETPSRCYRVFSDNYDIKEQWFYALNQVVLHREFIDRQQQEQI